LIKTQHYVFYPNGKGNTFPSIERENNKIKLITKMKNNEIIINPILTFNSFEKDPTLNYFRLECDYEENKKIKKGVFYFLVRLLYIINICLLMMAHITKWMNFTLEI
jgi:hypothetical protein